MLVLGGLEQSRDDFKLGCRGSPSSIPQSEKIHFMTSGVSTSITFSFRISVEATLRISIADTMATMASDDVNAR